MVQTRSRGRSLPGSLSSLHHDVISGSRSKSLISLNRCSSSNSTTGSASTLSLAGGEDAYVSECAAGSSGKREETRMRSPSSSSYSTDTASQPVHCSLDQPVDTADDSEEPKKSAAVSDASETNRISTGSSERHGSREEDDEVFSEPRAEETPSNSESVQLSIIDEEKDDLESSAPVEESGGEDKKGDEDGPCIAGYSGVRPRLTAAAISHSRLHSASSLDISHLYSQPEATVGDVCVQRSSSVAAAAILKQPLRRGLSSSFLQSCVLGNSRRPHSQTYDLLDKGTVLVALAQESSLSSKNLDRNLSASTPSIDSAVKELGKGNARNCDTSSSRKTKNMRTPSIGVPAITPRIPLVGLLPPKISKPDRSGDGTKPRERSSGFFGSRSKRTKQNEARPHFWIKNSCSNSDCCDVCSKALANTDAYQCNDCLSSVHASCKASLDKASCNKMKHPKPTKSHLPASALRPPSGSNVGGQTNVKSREIDVLSFNETIRNSSLKSHRHSVAGFITDSTRPSLSSSASLDLNGSQSSCRTYPNGFRSYVDSMEDTWKEIGLWDDLPDAWSTGPGKNEKKKLSSKEIKRQDNFHEMFVTEQHHCQTLTVLKCTYLEGLIVHGALSSDRLNEMLPCLDQLMDIHYQFFRSLKNKRDSTLVVDTVHDVLGEQFSNEMATKMIRAYTQFCFQKDSTVREYQRLLNSSVDFANFIKTATTGSFYKSRSLPDCLLLVTQRLSKYHSFVENLRKNTADDSPEKERMLIAERAVKELIAAVDSGIEMAQMQHARGEICNSMDPKASTELSVQDVAAGKTVEWKEYFKVEDLRSPDRTLLYYGNVLWQNARQKAAAITLLLFTDVIVFLQKNGSGGYSFFRQDQKNGVVRLHKLIVRDKAGRLGSQGIYLIAVSPKPDMYDISCKSKKELHVWMDRIQRAVHSFAARNINVKQSQSLLNGNEETELEKFFDRLSETNLYARCLSDARMKIYTEMFDYIAKLPLRSNADKEKIASLISNRKDTPNADSSEENAGMVWRAMQERFGAEAAAAAMVPREDEEETESIDPTETTGTTSTELGRSKTFHYVADNAKKPKLRKHPTVAGIPEIEERSGKRLVLPQVVSEMRQVEAGAASEATAYLLKCWAEFEMQNEELRQEKLRLTAELALAKERSRQTAGALACDSGLENLRRLSTELDARRKQFYQEMSDKEIELNCRERALKEREEKLSKEDSEIRNRWACLTSSWENQRAHGVPVPPLVLSPSSSASYTRDSSPPAVPAAPAQPDSSSAAVQRATSFRPADAAPQAHLAGAVIHGGRRESAIHQEFPTHLSSKDGFSLSKKFRASAYGKDKSGGKKHIFSSKSPDRQLIPNKLAIHKK